MKRLCRNFQLRKFYYRTLDIYEQLVNLKAAISRLQRRSAATPNQGLHLDTISLQEAKASSAIENVFMTDDELYKAFSDNTGALQQGPQKKYYITANHYRKGF